MAAYLTVTRPVLGEGLLQGIVRGPFVGYSPQNLAQPALQRTGAFLYYLIIGFTRTASAPFAQVLRILAQPRKGRYGRGLQPGQQGGYFFRVGAGKRKGQFFQLRQGRAVRHHAVEHLAELAGGVLLLAVDALLRFPLGGVAVGLHGL